MGKALLSFTNHVYGTGTTLTAEDQSGNLAPSRIADPSPQVSWRSAAAASAGVTKWVQADFGGDVPIDVVAGQFWRQGVVAAASDTVRLQLDADGGTPGTGAVLDVANMISATAYDAGAGTLFHKLSSTQTARYLRLTLTIAAARYAELGCLWAGEAIQPEISIGYPLEDLWVDGGRAPRGPRSGRIFGDPGPRWREMGFSFQELTEAEASALRAGQRLTGTTEQVLFCADTDRAAELAFLGRMTEEGPFAAWTRSGLGASSDLTRRKAYRQTEDL